MGELHYFRFLRISQVVKIESCGQKILKLIEDFNLPQLMKNLVLKTISTIELIHYW